MYPHASHWYIYMFLLLPFEEIKRGSLSAFMAEKLPLLKSLLLCDFRF
jgi:hypothetical protein